MRLVFERFLVHSPWGHKPKLPNVFLLVVLHCAEVCYPIPSVHINLQLLSTGTGEPSLRSRLAMQTRLTSWRVSLVMVRLRYPVDSNVPVRRLMSTRLVVKRF